MQLKSACAPVAIYRSIDWPTHRNPEQSGTHLPYRAQSSSARTRCMRFCSTGAAATCSSKSKSIRAKRPCTPNSRAIGDQFIACGIRKIVVHVRVIRQVDLRGQVTITRGRDEEVDMRRPLPVAPELIKQLLGRPGRRAAITRRHDQIRRTLACEADRCGQASM